VRVEFPRGTLTDWLFAHRDWLFVAGVLCRPADGEAKMLERARAVLASWTWCYEPKSGQPSPRAIPLEMNGGAQDWFERIWPPFRHELQRDWVSISELGGRVARVAPELDADARREVVLQVLQVVLERREADIGQFAAGGGPLVLWSGGPHGRVDRVRLGWSELGRDPNPGELAWLQQPHHTPAVWESTLGGSCPRICPRICPRGTERRFRASPETCDLQERW
jgi:hypothetical protein